MNIYPAISVSQSKLCNKCKITKLLSDFSKDKQATDKHKAVCKSCDKEYRQENKERDKKYYSDNVEYIKKYRKENSEQIKEYHKEYRQSNKGYVAANSAKRRAVKLSATPKWYEYDLINQLYIDRKLISEMTGILHHVDHIVPLQSDLVCGLHCMANLQIISATENHSKSNSYWPDMP